MEGDDPTSAAVAAPDPVAIVEAGSVVLAEASSQVPGFFGIVSRDLVIAATGLPFAPGNSVSNTRLAPDSADARIDEVIAWFDERGLPFVWHLGPADEPADLEDRLLAKGLALDPDEMPGMAAPLTSLPPVELPRGGTIEAVRSESAFRAWLDVMVAGFGMPAEVGDAFMKFAALGFDDGQPTRMLLARLDGRPVATALGVLAGGGLIVANVTTVADARGRGFGGAVTQAAMHAGAEAGATVAVLQSTEMGRSVYRRLGFEEFGRYSDLVSLGE